MGATPAAVPALPMAAPILAEARHPPARVIYPFLHAIAPVTPIIYIYVFIGPDSRLPISPPATYSLLSLNYQLLV